MDIFRTPVEPLKTDLRIGYTSKILLMGSCFTENIGALLSELNFPVLMNPFGILYNPQSIFHNMEVLLRKKKYSASDLGFHNGKYFSFDHHGRFSDASQELALNNINKELKEGNLFLKNTTHLILTLGSAWVYRLKKSNRIVANCHKIPDREFDRFLLSPDEIINQFSSLYEKLKKDNPGLHILFTISPVRHTRDGMVGNMNSKAILIVAVQEICKKYKDVTYFPSYEIMMDDLRDYRFYEEDMLHPNSQAISYIWKIFADSYFDTDTREIMEGMKKIRQARNHRPINPDSTEHRKFLTHQVRLIEHLQQKFPFLDLNADKKYFQMTLE